MITLSVRVVLPISPRARHSARRPQLAVGVHLALDVLRVVLGAVEPAQAVHRAARVRGRVPVGHAGLLERRLVRDRGRDRDGEVVAECLADRARLERGSEARHLVVLDRVAVLVHDHLGVLGVVDAALAVGDRQLLRAVAVEGVVAPELVDAHQLLALVDRRQGRPESERLDVALRLGHPVVRHHLLELILVARVDEPAAGVARRRPCLRLDLGVRAGESAGAVEVGQRLARVGRGERGVVRVLLVGQRLVLQRLHGIREEHLRRSGAARRRRLGRVRRLERSRRTARLPRSRASRIVSCAQRRSSGARDKRQHPRRAARCRARA